MSDILPIYKINKVIQPSDNQAESNDQISKHNKGFDIKKFMF